MQQAACSLRRTTAGRKQGSAKQYRRQSAGTGVLPCCDGARGRSAGMSTIASRRQAHASAGPTDANVTDPSAKPGSTAIYFLARDARVWRRNPSKSHEMAAYRRQASPTGSASRPVAALGTSLASQPATERIGTGMGIVRSGLVEVVRTDGLARVTAEITEQRWLALARALIVAGQPAAENPLDPDMPPGREEGISELVAARLEELGLSVELVSKRAGRPNVIGTLAGAAPD